MLHDSGDSAIISYCVRPVEDDLPQVAHARCALRAQVEATRV